MRSAASILGVALLAFAGPALAGSTHESRVQEFARLPDWGGLWIPENDQTSIGGLPSAYLKAKKSGDKPPKIVRLNGMGAPWNAEGKRRQAIRKKMGGNRKAAGWGFPMMMNAAAPIQFFITPEKVLIINGYRDLTDVRMAEKHPPAEDLWPTVWGDSVGHWEGDTLVIDTIDVKNPNHYFHGAPPLSVKAHYVQRIHLEAPGRLVDDITIEDPVTLTRPWRTHMVFVPAPEFGRIVYDVYDNDRTVFGKDNTIAPPQDERQNRQ